jgi:hypothetical protein
MDVRSNKDVSCWFELDLAHLWVGKLAPGVQ